MITQGVRETAGPNEVKGFQERFQMPRVGQDAKQQPSAGAHDGLPDRRVGRQQSESGFQIPASAAITM